MARGTTPRGHGGGANRSDGSLQNDGRSTSRAATPREEKMRRSASAHAVVSDSRGATQDRMVPCRVVNSAAPWSEQAWGTLGRDGVSITARPHSRRTPRSRVSTHRAKTPDARTSREVRETPEEYAGMPTSSRCGKGGRSTLKGNASDPHLVFSTGSGKKTFAYTDAQDSRIGALAFNHQFGRHGPSYEDKYKEAATFFKSACGLPSQNVDLHVSPPMKKRTYTASRQPEIATDIQNWRHPDEPVDRQQAAPHIRVQQELDHLYGGAAGRSDAKLEIELFHAGVRPLLSPHPKHTNPEAVIGSCRLGQPRSYESPYVRDQCNAGDCRPRIRDERSKATLHFSPNNHASTDWNPTGMDSPSCRETAPYHVVQKQALGSFAGAAGDCRNVTSPRVRTAIGAQTPKALTPRRIC